MTEQDWITQNATLVIVMTGLLTGWRMPTLIHLLRGWMMRSVQP